MIKNIIFDFDGVLVDSEILVAKAFAKYMQNFDIHIDEKEFASLAGKKTVQVIDILSKKYSIKDQQKFFTDIIDISSNNSIPFRWNYEAVPDTGHDFRKMSDAALEILL